MNSVLLTVALLAQQPDRNALEEAREQEAKVRALRKAHLEQSSLQAARDYIDNQKAFLARFEEDLERMTFSLLRRADAKSKGDICQLILRHHPQTPLGRFLRLGILP